MDQANKAKGRPNDDAAYSGGVASKTPQTTITLLNTWNVVRTGFDLTRPVAACIIYL